MYHFFVTSDPHGWDANWYLLNKSRFLEYTREQVAAAYQVVTSSHIEVLKTYPCLFAIEGKGHPMRVGRLTNIADRGDDWFIEFTFEPIPAIPYERIKPIFEKLDIRKWEMNRTHWAIKDEDLLQRLRQFGVDVPVSEEILDGAAAHSLPDIADTQEVVNSVSDFVRLVLAMNGNDDDVEVFYRGHSDRVNYKLVPSVLRQDKDGNYEYRDQEHLIYRELLVSNSADFAGDVYTLDHLVRMQHYSLPTRLLDITSNPLIGLYFACNSERKLDKEGEVIVMTIARDEIKYFDSDTASCIANLARLPQREKDSIDWKAAQFNNQPAIDRLVHFIREDKPFFRPMIVADDLKSVLCVKGKRTNSRIASQAGAFLLFGHDAVLGETGNQQITVKRIGVRNKGAILRELDRLNINDSTVFPYIEKSAKYIAAKFKFKATDELEAAPLDDRQL